MNYLGSPLRIVLITEDSSVSELFKSILGDTFDQPEIQVFQPKEIDVLEISRNESPTALFIDSTVFEIAFSTLKTIQLPLYVFGKKCTNEVLTAISEGSVAGFVTEETLLAITVTLTRSPNTKTDYPGQSGSISEFSTHFQSIADNMRSGVVRVLDMKNGDRQILFSNEGFYRLFEVSRKAVEEDFTVILKMIHPDDLVLNIQQIYSDVKKTGKAVHQYFRIITPSKIIRWIHLISNATETEAGDILHDFIVTDITDQKRREQFFNEISKVSQNGGWELDLIQDTLHWTDETRKIHEVPPYFQPTVENAINFYEDEDSKERLVRCLNELKLTGTSFDDRFEIITDRGNRKWVRVRGEAELVDGYIVRIFGIFQDISDLVEKENQLMESIDEKNALLGEIHHRVKNNLAIISGLLQLELMKGANNRFSLRDAVNRIQSIATVHEILYSTDNFNVIAIEEYLSNLTASISNTYPSLNEEIELLCKIEDVHLPINQAVPVGLLLNELITNSIKHAFNSTDRGQIVIRFSPIDDQTVQFEYADTGKGFDRSKLIDSDSLGFTLIQSLLSQLEAEYDIETEYGFELNCRFTLQNDQFEQLTAS
ncbi:MAG: PAS domain-containing protein [bacterium]|nr:PAS domain-containing protein [bacterium]